ncbi:DNA cytosine methyltransferase [Microcoleus sp. herbarium14]|uniref:DNA cytosine methyltransferase n=1 Tax=Microcoleus sp. herbarium14 TaxID=3055439 RepID=UPI002FD1B331
MILKCIDFFAGIGAWELASSLVNPISQIKFRTIEFIEINPQAQKVLRSHFSEIPIHDDVRSYIPRKHEADLYLVSFPCTNTSAAGKKEGLAGNESSLWFEALRCIIIGRPTFVVVENPIGVIDRGLRAIIAGLNLAGYEVEIEVISASELGAPHERQRVFVIAYLHDLQLRERQNFCCWTHNIRNHITIAKSFVSYPETKPRTVRLLNGFPQWMDGICVDEWWKYNQPPVSAGIEPRTPGRRECVSLYGKSIVPQCAAIALMRVQFLASLS